LGHSSSARADRDDRSISDMHRTVRNVTELRVHRDDIRVGNYELTTLWQRYCRALKARIGRALSKSHWNNAGRSNRRYPAQKATPANFTHGASLLSSGISRMFLE
jgi:hypothetical protein